MQELDRKKVAVLDGVECVRIWVSGEELLHDPDFHPQSLFPAGLWVIRYRMRPVDGLRRETEITAWVVRKTELAVGVMPASRH